MEPRVLQEEGCQERRARPRGASRPLLLDAEDTDPYSATSPAGFIGPLPRSGEFRGTDP
jgi:hypothetical protein